MVRRFANASLFGPIVMACVPGGDMQQVCDESAPTVSLRQVGSPTKLAGRWLSAQVNPAELLFGDGGAPERFRPQGWTADMAERAGFVFGCTPRGFPLSVGESNTWGRTFLYEAWERRTLVEARESPAGLQLVYRIDGGVEGEQSETWRRWILSRASEGRIAVALESRESRESPWDLVLGHELRKSGD